jgi:hypothetical protein
MIDPRRIVRSEKLTNQIRIHKTFLLKRDPKDKMVARSLEPEEAVEILRKTPEQWHNNYLTTFGPRKEQRRGELFKKLFEKAEPYQLNCVASKLTVQSGLVLRVMFEQNC